MEFLWSCDILSKLTIDICNAVKTMKCLRKKEAHGSDFYKYLYLLSMWTRQWKFCWSMFVDFHIDQISMNIWRLAKNTFSRKFLYHWSGNLRKITINYFCVNWVSTKISLNHACLVLLINQICILDILLWNVTWKCLLFAFLKELSQCLFTCFFNVSKLIWFISWTESFIIAAMKA
jgi:hypothetical protein